jgi:hypothetical protein
MSGDPQAIYVNGSVVVAVMANWYGTTAQGAPFHGSLVRALDCSDPAHVRSLGDVQVDGYVEDSSLVGNVLYTVGTDRDQRYGALFGAQPRDPATGRAIPPSPHAVIASLAVGAGAPHKIAEQTIAGDRGLFAFAPGAIVAATVNTQQRVSTLTYVDVSDPAGAVTLRGATTVPGASGANWGICGNTGGWGIDFADGVHARVLTDGGGAAVYNPTLVTLDFSNRDAPNVSSVVSDLTRLGDSQGVVVRFQAAPSGSAARFYVAHGGQQFSTSTLVDVYDLSDPTAPRHMGAGSYLGDICTVQPSGDQLFTVSSFEFTTNTPGIDVRQFEMADPTAPTVLGKVDVGVNQGASFYPALSAPGDIVFDATGALAMVPVQTNAGHQPPSYGLQIMTLSSSIAPAGTASLSESLIRAFFVQGRAYAVTGGSLTVFDLTDPTAPRQTAQLTLAPRFLAVQPVGSSLVEISSPSGFAPAMDLRLLPAASADDPVAWGAAKPVLLTGYATDTFANGSLVYVATSGCLLGGCVNTSQEITLVDTASGVAVKRSSVALPPLASSEDGQFYSATDYGWYAGRDVVQVSPATLAVRRPNHGEPLYVVDLSNPDAPVANSVPVLPPGASWWGDLQVFGDTLYVATYQPVASPCPTSPATSCLVAFRLVPVDVHDPAHPVAGAPISVPGLPIGASAEDPNTIYFANYVWDPQQSGMEETEITSCRITGGFCTVQGKMRLDGTIGPSVVQNDVIYATVGQEFHRIDLTNPSAPVDGVVPSAFFGPLLGLSGDTAVVVSGWSSGVVDAYRLNGLQAPTYQSTLYALSLPQPLSIARQGTQLSIAGDSWGVESLAGP